MTLSFKNFIRGSAAALALCAGFAAADAAAMTVQPVVVDLTTSGRGMTQLITVENTFANPLPVELRIEELTFDADGLKGTGKDPGDLLVFPPQALIAPGQTQSFRVQWVGDPALMRSKHYYVTVAQLPVELPEGQSAIQILYNFQVLVSVAPAGAKPALTLTSAEIGKGPDGKPMAYVTVENDSAAHGYLSQGRLRLVEKDLAGKVVFQRTLPGPEIQQTIGFGLIAPGQKRRIAIPLELPTAEGSLEAQFTPETRR